MKRVVVVDVKATSDLEGAQRKADAVQAKNQPTLKVSLGELLKAKGLR
jgi:hypothetical protein